ncbi:MAG: hypothetical protein HOP29_12250 [Phycisphaerales bacterium]|nr:hypothetical protein [Phycisphaerales bacterium]
MPKNSRWLKLLMSAAAAVTLSSVASAQEEVTADAVRSSYSDEEWQALVEQAAQEAAIRGGIVEQEMLARELDYSPAPADGPTTQGGNLTVNATGGIVNISGATLFVDFFKDLRSTNDWTNPDCDFDCLTTGGLCVDGAVGGECNPGETHCEYKGFADRSGCALFDVDQLATSNPTSGPLNTYWAVNYRSVGSTNGVQEFVNSQVSFLNSYFNTPAKPASNLEPNQDVESDGYIGEEAGCPAACQTVDDKIWNVANNLCGAAEPCGSKCNLDCICANLAPVILPVDCTPENVCAHSLFGCNDADCCFDELFFPTISPNEAGSNFNKETYYNGTACVGNWQPDADCPASCSFLCMRGIDIASTDVPVSWAIRTQQPGSASWDNTPGAPGYGDNSTTSWDTGFENVLKDLFYDSDGDSVISDNEQLNSDTATPDNRTVFNNFVAHSPVACIANRGTGKTEIRYTEAQHHWVTGRFPSGENLVAATRDSGSGTRNDHNNGFCIDPSYGRGENINSLTPDANAPRLGPGVQKTNCGGSGVIENVVRWQRLAIGYTGLNGASRAVTDATAGLYEILNVRNDDTGDGSVAVRPSKNSVLDSCNANTGYRITAEQTMATRGNVDANRLPGDPQYDASAPAVSNDAAAQYIINILNSQRDFDPAFPADQFLMPGQLLSRTFFSAQGVDCIPSLTDPCDYVPTPGFSQPLQDYIRANIDLGSGLAAPWFGDTPTFGGVNTAGSVPVRRPTPNFPPPPGPSPAGFTEDKYSDGSVAGEFCYYNAADVLQTALPGNQRLSRANRVQGDFDKDFGRDSGDVIPMVAAMLDPRGWQIAGNGDGGGAGIDLGTMVYDQIIPEAIGDMNGDGNFDKEDLRYYMDGLYLVGGNLDRKAGAVAIDTALDNAIGGPLENALPWALSDLGDRWPVPPNDWVAADAPANRCGNPTVPVPDVSVDAMIVTGAGYALGDFRGDVAGNTPAPGADPRGWDGLINAEDADYVCQNTGDWTDLDEAVAIDLSADMTGDRIVNALDVCELVEGILKTNIADLNLNGAVTCADFNLMTPGAGCWSDGDFDADHLVDRCDEKVLLRQITLEVANIDNTGPSMNVVDLMDVTCVLNDISGTPAGSCGSTDVHPECGSDGVVNVFDLTVVLDGFTNWSDSRCPDPCPGGPTPSGPGTASELLTAERLETISSGSATVKADVVLKLVPRSTKVSPSAPLVVDVFASGDAVVQGYQVALKVTGGTSGVLTPATLTVDKTREDYLFGQQSTVSAFDVEGGRMLNTLPQGGASVGYAYLTTFTFDVSADARGAFAVNADMSRTMMTGAANARVTLASKGAVVVKVGRASTVRDGVASSVRP